MQRTTPRLGLEQSIDPMKDEAAARTSLASVTRQSVDSP